MWAAHEQKTAWIHFYMSHGDLHTGAALERVIRLEKAKARYKDLEDDAHAELTGEDADEGLNSDGDYPPGFRARDDDAIIDVEAEPAPKARRREEEPGGALLQRAIASAKEAAARAAQTGESRDEARERSPRHLPATLGAAPVTP